MSVIEEAILIVDVKQQIPNDAFVRFTQLLKLFIIVRSDVLPFIFSLVDMAIVHNQKRDESILFQWLEENCRIECYSFISRHFEIEQIPEDTYMLVYHQRDNLVRLLLLLTVETVLILPIQTKEVHFVSLVKGWVVSITVRYLID